MSNKQGKRCFKNRITRTVGAKRKFKHSYPFIHANQNLFSIISRIETDLEIRSSEIMRDLNILQLRFLDVLKLQAILERSKDLDPHAMESLGIEDLKRCKISHETQSRGIDSTTPNRSVNAGTSLWESIYTPRNSDAKVWGMEI